MKFFTKLLIPVFLIASCLSGYGASVALGVSGEGVFMAENTGNAEANVSSWLNNSGNFNSTGEWSVLDKFAFEGLSTSNNANYIFAANANLMAGLSLINHNQIFDEGRLKLTLSAYPNPTKGLIQIELQSANESSKQLQLGKDTYKINFSNTIGKVLKTIKVPKSALDSKINLDLSDYPAGVYFYSLLVNDKMVETKRLILQQ